MHENKGNSFSKILVAVDGSEASIEAAKCATQLANKYESDLVILNVILSDISIFGPDTPYHVNILKQQGQDILDKVKEVSIDDTLHDDGTRVRLELVGSPSAVSGIVGFAEKELVGLIVIRLGEDQVLRNSF
jgi:nucleotide-binding universal stress UspA family protein